VEEHRDTDFFTTAHQYQLQPLAKGEVYGLGLDLEDDRWTCSAAQNQSACVETIAEREISECISKYAVVKEIGEEEKKVHGFDRLRGNNTKSKLYELMSALKFSCRLCSFQTKRKSHLEKHKKMHEENPVVFVCPEKDCEFKCIRNGDLTRHRSVHVAACSLLPCSTCSYTTTDNRTLNRHIKYAHNKKKAERSLLYRCNQCEYKTLKSRFFLRHMKRHNVQLGASSKPNDISNRYKCDSCEYSSKKFEHVKRHMASVHLQERKFICDACGMRFKRKDILHQHLQSHAYEGKLHNCGLCENTYKSAYSLKEHMAMHANKKDVQCKVCDKAFNTNMILQKHMKNVHDTPGYKCDICDKVVNTPFNLKRHRQRHTADSVMLENSYSAYLINDKDYQLGKSGLVNTGLLVQHDLSDVIPIQIIVEDTTVDQSSSEIV